jgi:hypothetical protein
MSDQENPKIKDTQKRIVTPEKKLTPLAEVKMATNFSLAGGSFNRLTAEREQCMIDDETGIIYFVVKGKRHRMSIHSSGVLCVTEK